MSLPAWVPDVSVQEIVGASIALVLVATVVRKLWPGARRIMHLVDDLAGESARPGVAARPGLMERMAAVEGSQQDMSEKVDTIHHEVLPNSGTSLRDEVNRNTEGIKAAHDRLDEHADKLALIERLLPPEG